MVKALAILLGGIWDIPWWSRVSGLGKLDDKSDKLFFGFSRK
jgi:hypothetical protein